MTVRTLLSPVLPTMARHTAMLSPDILDHAGVLLVFQVLGSSFLVAVAFYEFSHAALVEDSRAYIHQQNGTAFDGAWGVPRLSWTAVTLGIARACVVVPLLWFQWLIIRVAYDFHQQVKLADAVSRKAESR